MGSPSTESLGSNQMPQTLSPSASGRRRSSSASNSPEFEFWMLRNPSFPQPELLSADELFVDGVLLPLHLHANNHHHSSDDPPNDSIPDPPPNPEPKSDTGPGPDLSDPLPDPSTALGSSKRWKNIFKKSERKDEEREKEKKKERKIAAAGGGGAGAGAGAGSAELNIYIWPFSRSRSAGNSGNRPRTAANRKVSSAPCSRSNSAGESKSRKWPSSPSRGGVHLGRSSPVWKVRRGGSVSGRGLEPVVVRSSDKGGVQKEGNETGLRKPSVSGVGGGGGAKARVLNLNVPMCIGYRQHLSCRSNESSSVKFAAAHCSGSSGGGGESGGGGDGRRVGNLFNLRSLFTKKVY